MLLARSPCAALRPPRASARYPAPLRPHARSPGLCVCAGRLLAGCALTCSAARLLRRPPARCAFLPRWPSPLRRAPARTGPRGRGRSGAPTPTASASPGRGCLLNSRPSRLLWPLFKTQPLPPRFPTPHPGHVGGGQKRRSGGGPRSVS